MKCNNAETPYTHIPQLEHMEFGRALTGRELEMLAEYAKHANHKLAAKCLGISEQTSKNHLSAIRSKLGVGSTIQVYLALGWLKLPDSTDTLENVGTQVASLNKDERRHLIYMLLESL